MLTEAQVPLRPSSSKGVLLLNIDCLADWGAFSRWSDNLKAYRQSEFDNKACTGERWSALGGTSCGGMGEGVAGAVGQDGPDASLPVLGRLVDGHGKVLERSHAAVSEMQDAIRALNCNLAKPTVTE